MMGKMIITLAILPTVLYMRQRPEDMGLTPDGEPPVNSAQIPNPDHEGVVKPREPAWTLRAALSTQTLWFLVAATGAETMVRQAVNLHALASLIDRGVPVSAAAGVISFTVVVTGVTGLAWGFIVERLHVRYCAALAIIFKSLGIVVLVYADSIGWSILFGLLYGVGLGGSRLFSNLLFADYFGRKSLGAILGFVRPFHLVVDIAGPILASLAFDLTGSYSPALLFFLGAEAIALFSMAMAKPVPG
jgi:cyanate permease